MKTEIYTHEGNTYTLKVRDRNVNCDGAPSLWELIVTNQDNARVMEETLSEKMGDYLLRTLGDLPCDFLLDFAKNEIQRISGK